jgi:hypothetical protein
MILIDSVLVDPKVLTQPFSCDVQQCKGACCTLDGGQGAPLLESELQSIETSFDVAKKYLSKKSIDVIESNGVWEEIDGKFYTNTINQKDCVFVFYDNGIAKCSIEKSYFEGNNEFRKPISCHLFPIRKVSFGGDYIYYEQFDECKPALSHGVTTSSTVLSNSKDALVRLYGEEWFNNAVSVSNSRQQKGSQ